jgi:hypothetical protein
MTKEFLLDFYYIRQFFWYFFIVLRVFLNLFTIKVKPSMGSLSFMLNLLWDDCHMYKKLKKKNIDWA